MPDDVACGFNKSECKRRLLTLASEALWIQIIPLAMTLILAASYPLDHSSALAFSVTTVASLLLAMDRRYEMIATLSHEGKGAASELFPHALYAFAPGASLCPQYRERVA